jgi:hypothetical protein
VIDESQNLFLADRTRAMAAVMLSGRQDLTVVETNKDTDLDCHVFIDRAGKTMRLMFGVLLRGRVAPVNDSGEANKALGSAMEQFRAMGKFTYPVCLFFFTMRDDRSFFSWLAEPTVSAKKPKLVHHKKASCVELTDGRLDEAIEQIVAWYAAVEHVLVA